MSSQLEFIMQLYMMNLLQQQQQQQQQQQHQQLLQSPVKAKDLSFQPQQQQQLQPQSQQSLRTQKRKNSQNTICSSSRSCSPNSNLSPLPNSTNTNNFTTSTFLPQTPQQTAQIPQFSQIPHQQPMTQMLLNNLPPLTQYMLLQQQQQQQLQQQQQQITSSNLLLTPTTPNSSNNTTSSATFFSQQQSSLNMANYLGNNMSFNGSASNNSLAFPPLSTFSTPLTAAAAAASSSSTSTSSSSSSLFFPSAFTAQNPFITSATSSQTNFLQSSTVTSTPCSDSIISNNDKHPICSDVSAVGHNDVAYVVEDDDDEEINDDDDVQHVKTEPLTSINLEDDPQVFSSLHSSSGNSGTSANGNSKLLCSGVKALETTTSDSMEDSTQLPYTPEKSQNSQLVPTSLTFKDSPLTDDENSNVTPMTLKNAILTPPSSEQLSSNAGQTFESSSSCLIQTSCTSITTNNTCSSALSTSSSLDGGLTEENLKHLRKYTSYLECENVLCRQENLREHFHCFEEPCQAKILSKKDDIIRHFKWHKKRKESLLLGFARFSSSDDCAPEYGAGCIYNWKQTHYHCIYDECPKVYVSTSDVQMHANFHRKNSEIVQEGFRRFRAHENCKIQECPFYGKKTSHYHCCREGCNHTFKNKADMEKHKTYHMKDHQLTQDGFKKILKTEQCPFEDCKYSMVSNHIHCVRESCNTILHSSSQMVSHKRKHDRSEGEQNYQQFKSQRDSSEEESPKPVVVAPKIKANVTTASSSASTPLSSLSAEHFLARKRGRPPKKIQLPSDSGNDSKRIKLESSNDTNSISAQSNPATRSMINPFMTNFNNPAAAASASMDPNAPNFQLTHLMALFQLQNPLFYQNLYPGGMSAANMANILGAAAANGSIMPAGNFPNSSIKQEFNDKSEFKE